MWGIPCDCFEMGTCYSQKVPQEVDTASTPHIFSEQDAHYVILQKLNNNKTLMKWLASRAVNLANLVAEACSNYHF